MDHTTLYGAVNHGDGLLKHRFSLGGVIRSQGQAKFSQGGAKAGFVKAVLLRALLCLTGALQRRKMICHYVACVLCGLFSEVAEVFILLAFRGLGQIELSGRKALILRPHEIVADLV